MSNSSTTPTPSSWRSLYEAAVLEIDMNAIPFKISAAKEAIHARMRDLALADLNGEKTQLIDSLHILEDLVKMYHADRAKSGKS